MYINANINGFNTSIELPEVFAEREQIQTSDDSYVIRQGNLVEVGGVLTIQTTPVTKGTGTEGSKRVDLSSYDFTKIENAHIGDVDTQGFAVYATSTHTAPVDLKVRYFVKAIV